MVVFLYSVCKYLVSCDWQVYSVFICLCSLPSVESSAVQTLKVSAVSTSSAVVSWNSVQGATGYRLAWGPTPGTTFLLCYNIISGFPSFTIQPPSIVSETKEQGSIFSCILFLLM